MINNNRFIHDMNRYCGLMDELLQIMIGKMLRFNSMLIKCQAHIQMGLDDLNDFIQQLIAIGGCDAGLIKSSHSC